MEKIVCDMLVIGGGGSGLVAAVRGVECGAKKVVVLEKTKQIGGASVCASSISSVNSKVQIAAGNSERLADEMFSMIMESTRWVPNPDVVRKFVNTSGVFADWIEAKQPGSLAILENHRFCEWKGARFGVAVCKLLKEYCKKYGIEIYPGTKATKLLVNESGDVKGALAESIDTRYEIEAKSVVLSTGSFSRNKEMLKEYFPKYFDNDFKFEFEGGIALGRFADGDGIKMALEIGALPDHHTDVVVSGPTHHGSQSTRNLISRPETILVNKKGKRFMAEVMSHFAGNAMLNQPEALAYAVFDNDSLEYFMNTINPLEKPGVNPPIGERQLAEQREAGERLIVENSFSTNALGASRIADTLDEIAAFIGAEPSVFNGEIERYNAFCDNGRDEDFCKDPKYLRPIRKSPFYAMRGNIFWQCTRGGIVINENMEVVGKNNRAIKGLYATGDHASGWFSEYGYLGSTSLAWALISGYMAAESSCEYVKSSNF